MSNSTNYFNPDISKWKQKENTPDTSIIDDNTHKKNIMKHFEFFDWTISFTKNVVMAAFVLFILANIFITAMISIIFICSQQITALEAYIDKVYEMFITVIGGYIIKSATENTVKIVFSVLSDWLEKKYGIKDRLKEPEEKEPFIIVGGENPDSSEEFSSESDMNSNDTIE